MSNMLPLPLSLSLIVDFHTFGEIFEPIPWLVNTWRTLSSVPRTHRRISLSSTLASASPWPSHRKCLICVPFDLAVPSTSISGEPLTSVARRLGYVAPEILNQRGHCKPIDLLANGRVTSTPYQSSIPRWNADYVLQNHHLRPPCGYTPFRADGMNEMIQQTTGTFMIKNVEERFRRRYAWESGTNRSLWEYAYLTFAPYITVKTSSLPFFVPTPHVTSAPKSAVTYMAHEVRGSDGT